MNKLSIEICIEIGIVIGIGYLYYIPKINISLPFN